MIDAPLYRPRTRTLHPPCPKCGASLVRIRRNPFDRLLSLFRSRRRYRCPSHGCGWEGTLPFDPNEE
jgi:predicted RNA-binding Zn-ribbon protein involved in translation (DUF1610 family)